MVRYFKLKLGMFCLVGLRYCMLKKIDFMLIVFNELMGCLDIIEVEES